jgi:hypothetical protein
MSVIGGILCLIFGGGLWWVDNTITITEPILGGIIKAAMLVMFGLGILLFVGGIFRLRRFQ